VAGAVCADGEDVLGCTAHDAELELLKAVAWQRLAAGPGHA